MKKAMWKADKSGSFRFSDRDDPSQQRLFFSMLDDDWLANELQNRLTGQTLTEEQLEEFVLTQTPAYNDKSAVNKVRNHGRALPKKKGQFREIFLDKNGLNEGRAHVHGRG